MQALYSPPHILCSQYNSYIELEYSLVLKYLLQVENTLLMIGIVAGLKLVSGNVCTENSYMILIL